MGSIKTRVTRLEAARRLLTAEGHDSGSEALWGRLEAMEVHLLETGDDLVHKPTSSPAANAVRAFMRGEPETAAGIIRGVLKAGHQGT